MSKIKPFGKNIVSHTLAVVYQTLVAIRNFVYDIFPFISNSSSCFVISVGGIHAGGTGKTPLTMLITKWLCENGYEPVILSRGYGRSHNRSVIVQPKEEFDWEDVGDEPAMIRNRYPKVTLAIGPNRKRNMKVLGKTDTKKRVYILDDGFQHRQIKRDLNIVTLPPDPFCDYSIPMGTMREKIKSLKRADLLCIIGTKNDSQKMMKSKEKLIKLGFTNISILYQKPDTWINAKNGRIIKKINAGKHAVLSGIAHPERFYNFVEKQNTKDYYIIRYSDHHRFTADEINSRITNNTEAILTTEKDIIRMKKIINLVKCPNIWYLNIVFCFLGEKDYTIFFNSLKINDTEGEVFRK